MSDDIVARAGEAEAVRLLRAMGCEILARNAVVPFGEADIICRDPTGVVLIVEVKARVREADASPKSRTIAPGASITQAKRRKLTRIARYLRAKNAWERVRIDAIEVVCSRDARGELRVVGSSHHAGITRS